MTQTQELLQRYFRAWTTRDVATVRALLADDFRFSLADTPMGGREQFLDAGSFPPSARTELRAEAYTDNTGFQLYSAANGDKSVVIVEVLTVRDGKIAASMVVTDPAAFQSFFSG